MKQESFTFSQIAASLHEWLEFAAENDRDTPDSTFVGNGWNARVLRCLIEGYDEMLEKEQQHVDQD